MQGALTLNGRLGPCLPAQRPRLSTAVPYAFKAAAVPVAQSPVLLTECASTVAEVPQELFSLGEGLETPIQLIYLVTLLGFLAVGAYLVVRQVLIRRELDEGAKGLGERIRTGEATCEDYYELGVILTRKKLFTQATKNLEKAKKVWDGEESELAQVHNALGFCYFNMDKTEMAIQEYRRAVELQPGYVTAWNNLGDALEKKGKWRDALVAYQEALTYAPDNRIARQRSDYCKEKVTRLAL
ncbi:hypothetical protein VOLCADRAFT_118323 [Volvox carteri f. nagariensis]|uniref:Uncharacterized protein n=1 Tax=Volvox carteri f. nagariensis TaxID=3068 RepID=D8U491_VOLCA|nr:uncharacterized protein VOLCADRAFT_118323 [Volvox carteri f. nagariensis]EFJ45362.1 hypothetical protein VOLCADRAFT_118323 [Volvox carteri f. nagariensis]|eukprot:XP_002953389.1 hypothetical protein VOLCADRAFT_118323 [Volvox carteri f. nagariensis]